jgi:hypothetical protein
MVIVVKEIFLRRNISRPHRIPRGYGALQLLEHWDCSLEGKLRLHLHVVLKSARLGAIPPPSIQLLATCLNTGSNMKSSIYIYISY